MSRNYASLLLEVLRHEGVEQAHAEAGAPLRDGRLVLGGPCHPGDVEVSPRRAVLDEALQELRGGDRAAGPPATDVPPVGDVAVDLLVVPAAERPALQRLGNRLAGGTALPPQLGFVTKPAGGPGTRGSLKTVR